MADFTMKRGDTLPINHTVTDGGAAVNLTGKSLRFMAKRSVADADSAAVITKTIGSGITVTNPTGGLAQTLISPADTTGLPAIAQLLQWDLQMVDGSNVYTLESGTLLVSPDVSVTSP